jgi:hypothetical protein
MPRCGVDTGCYKLCKTLTSAGSSMVIVLIVLGVLAGMFCFSDSIDMKKLLHFLPGVLLAAFCMQGYAQPDRAQRELRVENRQMQREQRQMQQIESARGLQGQPPQMPVAPPVAITPPPLPPVMKSPQVAPQGPQGGPRRLSPEERQQLRDQIRDARRVYQQGQP